MRSFSRIQALENHRRSAFVLSVLVEKYITKKLVGVIAGQSLVDDPIRSFLLQSSSVLLNPTIFFLLSNFLVIFFVHPLRFPKNIISHFVASIAQPYFQRLNVAAP
jgi:hypothetical protein